MRNTSSFFIAFSGRPNKSQRKKTRVSKEISIWNLKKFTKKELIKEFQKKIPLLSHLKSKNCYKFDFIPKNVQLTWGILIEDTFWKDNILNNSELLAICNLFSDTFLNPLFTVIDLGIQPLEILKGFKQNNYWEQNKYEIFAHENFQKFYNQLKTEKEYFVWYVDYIENWIKQPDDLIKKENWRIFLAYSLFKDLEKYDYGKKPYTHLKEVVDIATILELLLTKKNENGGIKENLAKRSHALLGRAFKNIETEIKNLYKERSKFAHGSHYIEIAINAKLGANGTYIFPGIDFEKLKKYRTYLRLTLIIYIFLNKEIKESKITEKSAFTYIKKCASSTAGIRQLRRKIKKITSLIKI